MLYLFGTIDRIGGISGKKVYIHQVSKMACYAPVKKKEKKFVVGKLSVEASFWEDSSVISKHCLSASRPELVERALEIHKSSKYCIIGFENDVILSITPIKQPLVNNFLVRKNVEKVLASCKEYRGEDDIIKIIVPVDNSIGELINNEEIPEIEIDTSKIDSASLIALARGKYG